MTRSTAAGRRHAPAADSYRWHLAETLRRVAPRAGARVDLEPRFGFIGRISFAGGRTSYFYRHLLDLNPLASSALATDKDFATHFLAEAGFPVIEGQVFYSPRVMRLLGSDRGLDAGYRYARSLGWPVIVKPNSGSQGVGVSRVATRVDFYRAARACLRLDDVMIVQRFVTGRDFRLVVLDDKVIQAYERLPLTVVGDGRATIRQLLARREREFRRAGRDTRLDPTDPEIALALSERRLSLDSVLPRARAAVLRANANLSSGGEAVDARAGLHPGFAKVAVRMTREMGLRICGVDLLLRSGSLADAPTSYVVIEINARPGLDDFHTGGTAQQHRVDALHVLLLKALRRRPGR